MSLLWKLYQLSTLSLRNESTRVVNRFFKIQNNHIWGLAFQKTVNPCWGGWVLSSIWIKLWPLPLLKKEKKIESDTGQILNHRRTTNMGPNFGILEARLIGSCLGTLHEREREFVYLPFYQFTLFLGLNTCQYLVVWRLALRCYWAPLACQPPITVIYEKIEIYEFT